MIAGVRLIADVIHWHGIAHAAVAAAFFADLADEQQARRLARSSWMTKTPGGSRPQHSGRITQGKKKGRRK